MQILFAELSETGSKKFWAAAFVRDVRGQADPVIGAVNIVTRAGQRTTGYIRASYR